MTHSIPLFKTGYGIIRKYLPNFIVRLLVRKDAVAKRFLVSLNGGYGIEFQRTSIPTVQFQLVLTNHSPVAITVDRIHFQFWLGQPVLTKDFTRRVLVDAYTTRTEYIPFELADNQASKITDCLDENRRIKGGCAPTLRLDLECQTGIGWFTKTEHLNYLGEISR
jgi:hypothetical protein